MARRNSTPSHVAYLQLVLVIANNFMARGIHRRLGTTTYIVGNERPERHGRTAFLRFHVSCDLGNLAID
eukprot:scaffold11932_cov26-Attheya_sp.AAC.2